MKLTRTLPTLLITASFLTSAQTSQSVLPKSEPHSISVLLTISDRHGDPTDVANSDISLASEGESVSIQKLEPASLTPLTFAVVVDISGSNRDKIQFEKQAALQIFRTLATGENHGFLVLFNQKIARANQPLTAIETEKIMDRVIPSGGTALFDAIQSTCEWDLFHNDGPIPLRRAMILISDGEDNQSHVKQKEAIEAAQREGVPIFSLGLINSNLNGHGRDVLLNFSKDTGGRAVILTKPGKFDALFSAIKEQYVVTFVPRAGKNDLSSLEINASKKNLRISYPLRYPSLSN